MIPTNKFTLQDEFLFRFYRFMLHSDPDNKSFHFMFVRWTTSLLPNVKDQQKKNLSFQGANISENMIHRTQVTMQTIFHFVIHTHSTSFCKTNKLTIISEAGSLTINCYRPLISKSSMRAFAWVVEDKSLNMLNMDTCLTFTSA